MTKNSLGYLVCFVAVMLYVGAALAQDGDPPYECDNNYGDCGTPQQSGGGGGGGGGSILVNNTDLGDTYQYADDYDDDGIEDNSDNCPFEANPDQADDDGDGWGNACDNCPSFTNALQEDIDGDLLGDGCDDDMDGDSILNENDICPSNPDPYQKDTDMDGLGDACDDDMDGDGVPNMEDNCPLVANPDQLDTDPDTYGDACDEDDDADGIRNTIDNCLTVANYDQNDLDGDGLGDACDSDLDQDFYVNLIDNCPETYNPDQADDDRDGIGEECDDMYCYVIDGDIENCLDPTDPFTVYSPDLATKTGTPVRLRLFANRVNQPLRYTWEIVEAPSLSSATVENPTGAASISTPYEYHYLADRVVTFEPDKPGTYQVHVVAELVWSDVVTGERNVMAESYSTIEVTGDPVSACNIAPSQGSSRAWIALLPLLLLGLGLVTRRS
jgi:hypothetical protein